MNQSDTMFDRTTAVLGNEAMDILKKAHVAVFGLGGVGGSCAEALARAGVGCLTLVDHDEVTASNLNRQVLALHSTLGQKKTEVCKSRLLDINPQIRLISLPVFFGEKTQALFDFSNYDAVADCVDTLEAKLLIAQLAKQSGAHLVSCLGMGNRISPELMRFSDLYQTSVCPLARRMRKAAREAGIQDLRVLYSTEPPKKISLPDSNGRHPPGSVSFVPPAAGLLIAGDIIRTLIHRQQEAPPA